MAERRAIVIKDGNLTELEDGDTLKGVVGTGSGSVHDLSSNDIDTSYSYTAHHNINDTYIAVRYSLATGLLDGTASGSGIIPADLKVLTYV